jgi:anthranilate synthase component 1
MCYPIKKDFIKLSKKGNLIPIYKEILADTETPVSAFLKIRSSDYAFLLESVEGQEKYARFSFLGDSPSLIFESRARTVKITEFKGARSRTKTIIVKKDPLEEIKQLMKKYKFVAVKGLPRFCGGFVGYMGYDMVRFFEPRLNQTANKNIDDLKLPDSIFVLADTMVIFDHLNHKIKIVACAFIDDKLKNNSKEINKIYDRSVKNIDGIIERLKSNLNLKVNEIGSYNQEYKLVSNFSKSGFESMIK